MSHDQKPLNLELWLDKGLIEQQNHLKAQFIDVLKNVGDAFFQEKLLRISSKARGSKISQGNDLLGLPYLVLDLVRDFDSELGVNIRLLNWFGNGFYLAIQLGEKRINPVSELLKLDFSFGLSEGKWDYPDLILQKNFTQDQTEITGSKLNFSHWIKELKVDPDPKNLIFEIIQELKIILGILALPAQEVRN